MIRSLSPEQREVVRRVIKRTNVTHQLVAVGEGKVTTRCGLQWKKPKVGHGAAVAFHHTCSDCDEATEELVATLVVMS